MDWYVSLLKSPGRPSRHSRRAPQRKLSLTLEDLEGRRLLTNANAIQSFVPVQAGSATSNLISAADGDLWIAVADNNPTPATDLPSASIERIGLDGSVTSFPVPLPGNAFNGIFITSLTAGPDGNVWFGAELHVAGTNIENQVAFGYVTPAGVFTEFPPIPLPAGQTALPGSIVNGPGGELWFGYSVGGSKFQDQNFIGRVTTAGAITLFPISSPGSPLSLYSLTSGSDGNLWFTESAGVHDASVVGQMSPSGVVTQIPIGKLAIANVANGPNGSLILTGENAKGQNEVFAVSTAGVDTLQDSGGDFEHIRVLSRSGGRIALVHERDFDDRHVWPDQRKWSRLDL